MKVLVWIDGGCRGNGTQTTACYASVLIKGRKETLIRRDLPMLRTNNEAEYEALGIALEELTPLLRFPGTEVEIRSDSALLVNQVNGLWRCKAEHLYDMLERVQYVIDLYAEAGVMVKLLTAPRVEIYAKLGH